jgi:hypothetical protein
VVIELVLALPALVQKKAGVDVNLWFLRELDNVRPQTPQALEYWIRSGLETIGTQQNSLRQLIDDCLKAAFQNFYQIVHEGNFTSWKERSLAQKALTWTMRKSLQILQPTKVAHRIPAREGMDSSYYHYALHDLQCLDYRFVVCGHTHVPEITPLDVGLTNGILNARLYLNSGTWRRVYRRAKERGQKKSRNSFAGWDEECLVTIFSADEQKTSGVAPYEYYRINRGIMTRGE